MAASLSPRQIFNFDAAEAHKVFCVGGYVVPLEKGKGKRVLEIYIFI